MSDKPSYLGLLNAIAVNEARAHQYLQVWIDKTTDPEVEAVLRTVAWREGEHGMSFAKRVNELGLRAARPRRPQPRRPPRGGRVGPQRPREDGVLRPGPPRRGAGRLRHDLLGPHHRHPDRRAARAATSPRSSTPPGCCAVATSSSRRARVRRGPRTPATDGRRPSSELAALNDKVDALCRAVEELRQIVCAQTMPTKAS